MNPAADINNDDHVPMNIGWNSDKADIDKIPELVKNLTHFSDEPDEFSLRHKNIDNILEICDYLKRTEVLWNIFVHSEKNVGHADIALEWYSTD